jgi:hypothetical protein
VSTPVDKAVKTVTINAAVPTCPAIPTGTLKIPAMSTKNKLRTAVGIWRLNIAAKNDDMIHDK